MGSLFRAVMLSRDLALAVEYFDTALKPAERRRLVALLEKLAGPMDF